MNEGIPPNAAVPGADSTTKPLGDVIAINEGVIKDHLNKIVVTTVEETLNALLDAEADQQCEALRACARTIFGQSARFAGHRVAFTRSDLGLHIVCCFKCGMATEDIQ